MAPSSYRQTNLITMSDYGHLCRPRKLSIQEANALEYNIRSGYDDVYALSLSHYPQLSVFKDFFVYLMDFVNQKEFFSPENTFEYYDMVMGAWLYVDTAHPLYTEFMEADEKDWHKYRREGLIAIIDPFTGLVYSCVPYILFEVVADFGAYLNGYQDVKITRAEAIKSAKDEPSWVIEKIINTFIEGEHFMLWM